MLNPKECPNGQEQWEEFDVVLTRRPLKTRRMVQYDYRAPDGQLFSCVAPTLEIARQRRDDWIKHDRQ